MRWGREARQQGGLLNHKQGKAATRGAGARRRHGASAHVATVREERERTDRRVPLADFYTFCKVLFQLKPVALRDFIETLNHFGKL